ncbi:MAG: (Fe-S)-binding protein [Gammaproteobacteria bacterium]
MNTSSTKLAKPKVGLFVTCLVDLFRPSVGFAAAKLIEQAGCEVVVPNTQTCCGQPAYNSGDRSDARALATQTIHAFEHLDYVVAPSGSCAAMLKKHYPSLFQENDPWKARANRFAEKVFELVAFLSDVMKIEQIESAFSGTVTYHDSCSGLRELGIKAQPRALLNRIPGVTTIEMKNSETCCGFGGAFCVKYADISNAIVEKKTQCIQQTGADLLLAGDLGCLMNIAGKIKREGGTITVRHIAEVLANILDKPPIAGN